MKKHKSQIFFIIFILILWQVMYMLEVFPKLMFPSIPDVLKSLITGFTNDDLLNMVLYSMKLIIKGLGLGIVLAFIFSSLSIISKTFHDIYNMIVSMCDLIPGVALIPIAILWFGIGEPTIIAIIIHSVLWPLSRSIIDGFESTPQIYIEIAKNLEISKLLMVFDIYLPSSFHRILSGLKVGWARAWRGLISAEMIFGTTSSGAGIGWYIFLKRTTLDIPSVYAALIVIISIGFIVEYLIFNTIEKKTIKKWGIN